MKYYSGEGNSKDLKSAIEKLLKKIKFLTTESASEELKKKKKIIKNNYKLYAATYFKLNLI